MKVIYSLIIIIETLHWAFGGVKSGYDPYFGPVIFPTADNISELPLLTGINVNTKDKINIHKTPIQQSSEAFALDVFWTIADAFHDTDANFMISPFSIWTLMVLVAEGASDRSLAQLEKVLRLPNDLNMLRTPYRTFQRILFVNTTTVQLMMNQALFSDTNCLLNQKYIDILRKSYEIDYLSVNFRLPIDGANQINDHISNQTQGKITNVVKSTDLDDAQLVLTSSIFFRGQWKYQFDVKDTEKLPFYRENGEFIARVPMMTQLNNFAYAHDEELNATFVDLPYGDDARFSMILIYPHTTLTTVFQHLRGFDIARIHHEIHRDDVDEFGDAIFQTTVTLPKFSIDSDLELRAALEQLGIVDIFDGAKANLPKISNQASHISRVYQKAIIEVDEFGSAATAASATYTTFSSLPQHFIFDRPFGFLITDRITHTLLFAGQVRYPLT